MVFKLLTCLVVMVFRWLTCLVVMVFRWLTCLVVMVFRCLTHSAPVMVVMFQLLFTLCIPVGGGGGGLSVAAEDYPLNHGDW